MTYNRAYFNDATGIIIKFSADDRFVIIGNDDLVSDDDLMALHAGDTVEGWEPTST